MVAMLYVPSMSIVLYAFVLPSDALEVASNYTFAQFTKQFARSYVEGGDEHKARQAIFEANLADILAHNAQGRSWKKGVNHLTDLSESEMKQRLGYKPSWNRVPVKTVEASSYLEVTDEESSCMSHSQSCAGSSCCSGLICGTEGLCVEKKQRKTTVDWAEKSPTAYNVLEQGQCGSCWAVAASAAVQLHADIVSNNRFRKLLSPQSLLSCTPNEMSCGGEGGCQGATAELAFKWLAAQGEKGGMLPLEMQEYNAVENKADCVDQSTASFLQQKRPPPPMVSIKGFKTLEVNSGEAMMDALVNVGPVVASIVGGGLRSYSSGVIDQCDNFIIDHAVVMMGYGADSTLKDMAYWKVRNSWGPSWGERGHFRLQRFQETNGQEPCGWDTDPSKGVACKDKKGPEGKYPDQQWFCGACGILSDTAYPFGTHVPEALLEKHR